MRSLGIAAVTVALLLTGCASAAPSATPEAKPAEEPNAGACEAFADATSGLADAFNESEDVRDAWEQIRADMDAAALSAEGDVKERIAELVADWPSVGDIGVYADAREAMNEKLDDIARACDADGQQISYSTFS